MSNGFLVTLGDNTIDVNDAVAPTGPSTFTAGQVLGRGSVEWRNGGNSARVTGNFVMGEDGNVYFVPDVSVPSRALGGTARVFSYSGNQPTVPCFVAGTLIDTPTGPVAVETLAAGDLVTVHGSAPQPILWTGARDLTPSYVRRVPVCKPIELCFGSTNTRLRVSPQHALYVRIDGQPLLVRARQLVRLNTLGARPMCGIRQISYHHLLLPSHGIIKANGVWCESLLPGPCTYSGLTPAARRDLLQATGDAYGPAYAPYSTLPALRAFSAGDLVRAFLDTNATHSAQTYFAHTV